MRPAYRLRGFTAIGLPQNTDHLSGAMRFAFHEYFLHFAWEILTPKLGQLSEVTPEALAEYGTPEIFNTDQGCQFTSQDFTEVLKRAGVRISMDGKGRWIDNVFIERLWRSLKYECVYLHDFQDGPEARDKIGTWIRYYNEERPHSSHGDDRTPMEEYTRAA